MTAADPVPAPLEASDPQRARALKAKIRDRVSYAGGGLGTRSQQSST